MCCDLVRMDLEPFLLIQLRVSSRQMMRDGRGWFGGDVDLCVISVAVKTDSMVTEKCAKVNDEKK